MLDVLKHRIQCLIHFEAGADEYEATTLRQRTSLIEGDFCIATTFVQPGEDLLEKVLLTRVDPDFTLEFSRCILDQPTHYLGILLQRPGQDFMFCPFKNGLQEDVPLVEDLLAGRPLELDQLSVVLLLDRLHPELAEPIELLLRNLFLRFQKSGVLSFLPHR